LAPFAIRGVGVNHQFILGCQNATLETLEVTIATMYIPLRVRVAESISKVFS
jgi:hypothetical protein